MPTDDRQAKQRFLDLKVGNVDLVDTPANDSEFLAVKSMTSSRTEVHSMSTAKAFSPGNPEGSQAPTPQFSPGPSTQPPLNADGTNVSQDLQSAVASLNKACSTMKEGTPQRKALEDTLKALKSTLGTDIGNETDAGDTKKTKAAGHKEPDGDEGKGGSGDGDGDEAKTAKAGGKQFSKERMAELAKLTKGLLDMVKSVDEGTYKSLVEAGKPVDSGEGTAGVKPLIPTSIATPETKKALDEMSTTLKNLNETVQAVAKRQADMDAAAAHTKSDADNGVVDTKKSVNIWSGVL